MPRRRHLLRLALLILSPVHLLVAHVQVAQQFSNVVVDESSCTILPCVNNRGITGFIPVTTWYGDDPPSEAARVIRKIPCA